MRKDFHFDSHNVQTCSTEIFKECLTFSLGAEGHSRGKLSESKCFGPAPSADMK